MVSSIWGAVDRVGLTLSGRNLLTFTKYTGIDPEVSNFGNQPSGRNIDVAPFPPSRSFWLGIDVGFLIMAIQEMIRMKVLRYVYR